MVSEVANFFSENSNKNIFVVPFDVKNAPNFDAGQQQVPWDEGPSKYGIGDAWYKVSTQLRFLICMQITTCGKHNGSWGSKHM